MGMLFRQIFVFSCIFAFLLFFSMGFASQIAEHHVSADIDDDSIVHFDVEVTFVELNTERVNYLVFARIANAKASDVLGELECIIEKENYGSQISCIPNSKMKENYTVEFSFDAYDIVRKSGGADLFSYSYSIKDPTSSYDLRVLLPEGAALLSADDFDPYFPPGAQIGTVLGRKVSLEWNVLGPELGRTYIFESHFEFVGKPPEPVAPVEPAPDERDYDYRLLAIIGLIGIAAILAVRYYFLRIRKKDGTGVKRVFSVLKDDERKVVDFILEKGEKCKQRDIVRATDFSKAKVSRIMLELEERGILSRVRVGRTNKVVLNTDVKRDRKQNTSK